MPDREGVRTFHHMIEHIARFCARRRWSVVVAWLVLLVVVSGLASVRGGEPRSDFSLPGSETQATADLLAEGGFGGRGGIVGQLVFAAPDVTDADVRRAVSELVGAVDGQVEAVTVTDPSAAPGAIAPDGSVAIALVEFGDVLVSDAVAVAEEVRAVGDAFTGLPEGVVLEYGGDVFWEEVEFSSEAVGLLAAVVILLFAFGSVLAMGLPIATALLGIGCGMAIVGLAANVIDVPEFAPAAVAMVGIGVGIDYALMIVTRYREELAGGFDVPTAIVRSLTTAGRAVFFAGTTVVVSMAALFAIGVSATRSLALSIMAGVAMVLLASLTLLPALLAIVGNRIDRLRVRRHPMGAGSAGSFWYRWSAAVQRRPAAVALVGLVVLSVLAAPTLSMRLGFGDAGNRPETDTARRAHDLVAEGFGPGANAPLVVGLDPGGDPAVAQRFVDAALDDPGVARVGPPTAAPGAAPDGGGQSATFGRPDVMFVEIVPTTGPQDEETSELVHRLRDDVVPAVTEGTDAVILVGGATAAVVDFADDQARRLPLFMGAVLAAAFVLLMFVYRSLLVPLKAVVMNLVSIGAAYGVLVAVFQWGWGAGLLGLGEPGPIDAWVPMMLFAIVFGLSMDYEVFLLSRIREHYLRSGDNSGAVADGLARTARLITAAAAVMVFVFGSFVLSADRSLQLFGFGLAVAVLIDATVVRLLLVPATMELLGDRNWWFPGRRRDGAPS